jgi:hypothetical protein
MIAMESGRWSLGDRILVVVVISLAGLFVAAFARNHGWPTFGLGPAETTLVFLLAFWFFSSSRKRGRDD